MKECCERHSECLKEPSSFPTRLLDVGSEDDTIRLVDGLLGLGLYACLSYCVSTFDFHISFPAHTVKLPNIWAIENSGDRKIHLPHLHRL